MTNETVLKTKIKAIDEKIAELGEEREQLYLELDEELEL